MSRYLIDEIDGKSNIHVLETAPKSSTPAARTGSKTLTLRARNGVEDGARGCAFHPHRRRAAHRVAPAGDRAGRARVRSTKDDYATSVPGVFAIGDVRSGSVKRVASAVGEGSVVIQHVHHYVDEARLLTKR